MSVIWHRILEDEPLPEGRTATVTVGAHSYAVSHIEGRYGALDNRCPHQGGPLGEGTIEGGLLRCPWHGYDYDPVTGQPPSGFGDCVASHPVEVRDDGIWLGLPPERAVHERTTTDAISETLVAWGVDTVFGMVGHSNLGMADALRRRAADGELQYIGIRHEGAAAFAASAYGKLTGRPAACLAIAGPGATNLLTGLWDAHVDRSPVIALTGQVATSVLGVHNFQELDLRAAFGGVAAWSTTVLPDSQPAELAALAAKHATLTPGVSHLVLPDEVQTLPSDAEVAGPEGRVPDREIAPPAAALADAAARLRAARRPVVIVGHGARFAMDDVVALAEHHGAPVLTTFKAKGQIPDDHPLAAGVLGRSGTPVASWLMNEADLLVVFGASFSNHPGIYAGHPIIQVDSDPLQLGKFHPVTVPVWGDVGVTARALLADTSPPADRADQAADVARHRAAWQAEKASRAADDHGRGLASAAVFAAASAHCPEDAVISVDVGNHAYAFGRYFECRPGQAVLMSGYLGSIGFGFPAAMGAWAATRGARPPWCVTGAGGFGQYLAELTTAVRHRMSIVHLLLDNGELAKISKEQRAGGWDVWETGLTNPDFADYANSCGALGLRARTRDELDTALATAVAHHDGPVLVHITTDADLT
ncbi:MAG: thiamine pyrophosphate-binding protein [Baekduiaceae bacterium]